MVMGIGPAFAIPKVLELSGLNKDEIDIWEINEAFASQAVMSIQHVGLNVNKVNPNGGAIAFGHPLGCTGARQIATLLPEMKRQNATLGVTSMCIGSGMGMVRRVPFAQRRDRGLRAHRPRSLSTSSRRDRFAHCTAASE